MLAKEGLNKHANLLANQWRLEVEIFWCGNFCRNGQLFFQQKCRMYDCQGGFFHQISHDGDRMILSFNHFSARVAAVFFRLHLLVHRASGHVCVAAGLCFLEERKALQVALAKMEINAE